MYFAKERVLDEELISETVEIFFFNGFVEKVCNLFIYLLAVLDCCNFL